MATKIPSARKDIYIEGAQFRSAVSEELIQRVGGSINWLNENLKPLNYAYSLSSGNYSSTSTSESAITNLTVTITTLGNPVLLRLVPASSFTAPGVSPPSESYISGRLANLYLKRAALYVANFKLDSISIVSGGSIPATTWTYIPSSTVIAIDAPVAGTYTYSVSGKNNAGGFLESYNNILVAQELTP